MENQVVDRLEDLKRALGYAPIMEQKAFLKSFVKSINVSHSDITVNSHFPCPHPISIRIQWKFLLLNEMVDHTA
jgi:hypothetical protein